MSPGKMSCIVSQALAFALLGVFSCSGSKDQNVAKVASTSSPADTIKLIRINSPGEKGFYRTGQQIEIAVSPVMKSRVPDSVVFSYNGKRVATVVSEPWKYTIAPELISMTGKRSVKATAWKEGRSQSVTRFVEVLSDIIPARKGYRVVHSYPHSRDAFTQGLVFDKGLLYEGTGQETGSSLREVELTSGKVLRQHNLESSLFGEGIALLGDRIFQVTWQNKVGFVYDKATFRVLKKIYYPTQGWGLTTVNGSIVMGDGSNVLYFYEPEMFTVISRIEVYDNEGPVSSLNELEYISGEIWANIWMKDLIARIDPSSGRVLSYVDLKGLLPDRERNADTDVLNGIAWDPEGKKIYVTGKKWPLLFEISVIE
jgi:glutamine cyclotransferase